MSGWCVGGVRWCMGGGRWCVGGVWTKAYYSRLACMYTRVVYFAISEASGVALPKGMLLRELSSIWCGS
jgi:hypothetical protein